MGYLEMNAVIADKADKIRSCILQERQGEARFTGAGWSANEDAAMSEENCGGVNGWRHRVIAIKRPAAVP